MDFYQRSIKYYRSFRLIDSDGDGIKDTLSYKPWTSNFYIQFGLNQNIKDIGNYFLGENQDFDIIDLSSVWNESDNGTNNNGGFNPPNLEDPFGEDTGSPEGLQPNEYCNDPNASNYDGTLVGNPAFIPCPNNQCCQYLDLGNWTYSPEDGDEIQKDCLAIYTDWGPWNDNLLLDDTEQLYVGTETCTITFRFINQLSVESNLSDIVDGGWYGASLKIEMDSGSGYQEITPSSQYIQNIENDIDYNSISLSNGFTLNKKVRIWKAKKSTIEDEYYSTKPFRDLTILPPPNTTIRLTYNNSQTNIYQTEYQNYAKYLRLQVIKGSSTNPIPTPPTMSTTVPNTWAQNTPFINAYLGLPSDRINEGETFHYLSDVLNQANTLKNSVWEYYLGGDVNGTNLVPWGPFNANITVDSFYNNGAGILYDFGQTTSQTVIQLSNNNSLSWIQNPSEEILEYNVLCSTSGNFVSYYDRNGDGFIEYDSNYPTIDPQSPGSVDIGLFSKTRYDSPYIYLTPGTKDGSLPLTENGLTNNNTNVTTITTAPSLGGWRGYKYATGPTPSFGTTNYMYQNVSPTCQLGGCDNIANSIATLSEPSNSNIFLPQSDYGISANNSSCANYGSDQVTVTHLWNYGPKDAKGGCCAKHYDSGLDISYSGPYLNSKCSRCHLQMTTRSAQPIFDNNIKIQMQTTDSDIYYGPFYDSQNPTYNGYGLAFSKANKFCRDIKNKNGVQVINSNEGEDELYIGGILHGGGVQISPNTNLSQNLGVSNNGSFESSGAEIGCINKKLPLKCQKVTNDPNCPSGNCMKCIYCFKCSTENKQPGIFIGNNGDTLGPSGGVTVVGDYVLLNSFGQEVSQIEINNAPCVDPLNIEPTEIRDFTLEVIDTPVSINLFLDGGPGGGPDCLGSASISQDLAYIVTINDGMGGPINNTIFTGTIGLNDTNTLTETINNTGTYQGQIKIFPYYRNNGFTVRLTAS